MNLFYLLFLSFSRAWKKHKLWYKPSDNFCCIVLFKLYSIWSCSRAWKKHKLWYKPGDEFFHILLFMHGHGRGAHLGTRLVQQ